MSNDTSWGIIRYAPGTGSAPEDDNAAFDGWYALHADAVAIFDNWCTRFPGWIIARWGNP